jgi:hypothetical protein
MDIRKIIEQLAADPEFTAEMQRRLDEMDNCLHSWSRWKRPELPSQFVSSKRVCHRCGTTAIRFHKKALKKAKEELGDG